MDFESVGDSCPYNPELARALKTPEAKAAIDEMRKLLDEIPCTRDGRSVEGGGVDSSTMTALAGAATSLLGAVMATSNAIAANNASCGLMYAALNVAVGQGYCATQSAALGSALYWAAAGTFGTVVGLKKAQEYYAADERAQGRGGRRRNTKRKKSKRKKSHKRRTHRRH